MKRSIKPVFYLLLSIVVNTPVVAQQESLSAHTIQLNYRQAEDVMPLIRPFLHPQGVMTGQGYKILVKTSETNYRDLLQFVAEIDVSLRQLRVSVTIDSELAMRENLAMHGTATQTGEDKILENLSSKQYSTGRRDKSALTQQVQVLEGKWANISTGESVPIGQRTRNPDGTITESINYKSVNSGFQVLPRISGEQLSLFIRPQLDTQHREGGGRIQTRSAETTLTGKLNQWILIGGASQAAASQPGSGVYSTKRRKQLHNQIFVKVEVIQ